MYLDDAVTAIVGFEDRIHWMYLDTTGNVTVGVGQCLPTPDAALLYPFRRQSAEFATRDEILAQYETVKQMTPGHVPGAYRRFESLLLTDLDIDTILRNTLLRCAVELAALFPDFHDYPDPAKIGLIDMRFNLGLTRLREEFHAFCRAVSERRWDAAAAQCHRIQPSKGRNQWTREQFIHAGSLDATAKEIA